MERYRSYFLIRIIERRYYCLNPVKCVLVKSEINGSIQQFFEENGLIQSLKNDLNYVTTQRYQLVNMWFSRMVERKNDWNQTRKDMKDKLTGKQLEYLKFLLTSIVVILSSVL